MLIRNGTEKRKTIIGRGGKAAILAAVLAVAAVLAPAPAAPGVAPVTSTEFSRASRDEPIVQRADEDGAVTAELAAYLADEAAPLDVRAAVINAIGWEAEGGGRAEALAQYAYGKSFSELDMYAMRPDERFVFGYLLAMDDYFDTAAAEDWLYSARLGLPDSFTAAMIHALVAAQSLMWEPDAWQEIWRVAAAVAFDEKLLLDMRPEAAKIIVDYMALYGSGSGINPFSDENVLEFRVGDPLFTMNGMRSPLEQVHGAAPVLRGGTVYLPVRFLAEAAGGAAGWDSAGRKVTVTAPRTVIEFTIGSPVVLVNGEERRIEQPPILSRGRAMLPARFLGEALGFEVAWDAAANAVVLTYPPRI